MKSTNLVAQDQGSQEEVGVMQGVDVTTTTMRNDGSMRKEEGLELEENTQIHPRSPGLRCRTGGDVTDNAIDASRLKEHGGGWLRCWTRSNNGGKK